MHGKKWLRSLTIASALQTPNCTTSCFETRKTAVNQIRLQTIRLHMVLCKLLRRSTLHKYTVASFETISLMSFARSSNGCETKQMTVSVNQILLSCHPQPLRYNSDIKVCIKLGFLQGQIFRVAAKIWNVIPKLCA